MTKRKKGKKSGQKQTASQLQKVLLQHFQSNARKQYNPKQLIRALGIANNKDSVQHALDQLVQSSKIKLTDNYKYQLNKQFAQQNSKDVVVGRVDMTRNGAAFIVVDGREEDIFVSTSRIGTAFDGDKVRVRFWKARGRQKAEGEIVEVLERSVKAFVGTLHKFHRLTIVKVDGPQPVDILVKSDALMGAKQGDRVVVQVTNWEADSHGSLKGEITAVLGEPGSSDIEMKSILINNGFDIVFPKKVLAEAEALPSQLDQKEIQRRRDMREVTTFTIDPVDAKDFDDALSIQTLENGRIEVGVHIADVSYYVKPGSALDQEAAQRTTSVYLVDRVCPMLPERISNELCSLRPNEDKFTFSAVFEFDPATFQVRKRWFGRTVTHSDRRFNYGEAQTILDEGQGDFHEELAQLKVIADKLRERRFKAGSIDFASDEVRFRLDKAGKPLEVYIKERIDTNMLIEDFMLLANREVATYIDRKEKRLKENIPFVYRVHDEPDPEKVAELANFAAALGIDIDMKNSKTIARSYNDLMSKAEEDPAVKMLAPLAIRTMAKAVYTTNNIGHYGLGFDFYSHFTSPIRRYADVLTHRILDKNLTKGSLYQANPAKLEENCKHISNQERKAVTAERESIKYKQVEFIQEHIGETFEGTINGLADFGVFVELKDSFVEGMISYDHMDESYDLAPGRLSIVGRRSGKRLRMGNAVRVKVLEADLERRRVDLALVEIISQAEKGQKPSKGKPKKRSIAAKSNKRKSGRTSRKR
ncbi:MAG: ribonuclease R [Bacteroidota bacterium]